MRNKKQSPSSTTGAKGYVRIIGGDWRGRKLPVLEHDGLRPTGDRARETLFNWLQFELAGAVCLDAFAGTGALGFEALSRGASQVTLIEKSTQAARQLQANADLLNAPQAHVLAMDALSYLAQQTQQTYGVVFIDPPFHQGLVQPTLDALFNQAWLKSEAWIYIEQEKMADLPKLPENWSCYREKTTAQTYFSVWRRRQ